MVLSAMIEPMSGLPSDRLRVFAFKAFVRFARRFRISDEELRKVLLMPWDADLGGGLYKYRIARPGEGARGGGRALVALKVGQRAVLMFGFEKKDMGNIKLNELKEYRDLAKIYLSFSEPEMTDLVKKQVLIELTQSR